MAAVSFTKQLLASRQMVALSPPIHSLSLLRNTITTKPNSLSPKVLFRGMCTDKSVRVGGEGIKINKKLEYSLQEIYGIGRNNALQIVRDLSLANKFPRDLSDYELFVLRDQVSKYMIKDELRRSNDRAIKRLQDIQCYRGIRHTEGLPCRGQRTKTNSKTMRLLKRRMENSDKKERRR